jgi:ribosomal protein S18 acetylase RimI-like enzyme
MPTWDRSNAETSIQSVGYRPEYALELVKLWRGAFQRAMAIEEHNRFNELSGHLDFFATIDPASLHVLLDTTTSEIVGFMALSDGYLNHLYVHVDRQGQGLGSRLIDHAKSRCPERIELHTFQRNTSAQKFYLSHGFREIERGFAASEDNPWATSPDQLADIRYRWEPD